MRYKPVRMKHWEQLLGTWSPEKAWALGVIWGDGNVCHDEEYGTYRVAISGSISTTTRWAALMCPQKVPQEFLRAPGTFQVYQDDKELQEWFTRTYGMVGPKAHFLGWPHDLPADLHRDFIRGLWDSDGCLSIDRRRHKGNKGNDAPTASYTSATKSFVLELRDRLRCLIGTPEVCAIRNTKYDPKYDKTYVWFVVQYTSASAMLVADWLYASPPAHLVNDDRLVVYREQRALWESIQNARCSCGGPSEKNGKCTKCWWAAREHKTGPGSVCTISLCGKPVQAKGLCSACYSRVTRREARARKQGSSV